MCRRDKQKKSVYGRRRRISDSTVIVGRHQGLGGSAVCQSYFCRKGDCRERFHAMEGGMSL